MRKMMASSDRYAGSKRGQKWADKINKTFTEDSRAQSTEKLEFLPGFFSWAKPQPRLKQPGKTIQENQDFSG